MEMPVHISWALARNPDIVQALLLKYPLGHGYWDYLDDLISSLISTNCKGIQNKIADVGKNNLWKFQSMISELEIARLLSERGKHVEMLPDNFLPTKSPDMYVKDTDGEYYVEVVRFSEDEAIAIIQDELADYLADQLKRYRVDVALPADLSMPATNHEERRIKEEKARTVVLRFKQTLSSMNLTQLPPCVKIDDVIFHFSSSSIRGGFLGIIDSEIITLPSNKYVNRIRFLLTDERIGKAVKRTKWTGDHLKKAYIVAIDCEQPLLDDEDVVEALLGKRESYALAIPQMEIPPEVLDAAKKNWTTFLQSVHMLPKSLTAFSSYGTYLTNPICKNVSGVLVYKRLVPRSESMVCFLPNPFAEDIINDSRLARFL